MKELLSNRIKDVFPASLLLTFTFFIFGVLEMYITNIAEFWFSMGDLLLAMVPMFALSLIVLTALGTVLNDKVRVFYVALLFGLGLALYIQGNYLNNNFGILDGQTIDWSQFKTEEIISTVVWVLLPVVSLVLAKVKPELLKSAVAFASFVIVVTQTVTLVVSFIPIVEIEQDKKEGDSTVLTTAGEFELSKNENVLVFLVDAFDAQYFTNLLEQDPESMEHLDGFTFYNDITGAYNLTKVSIPFILTGQKYLNEQYFDDYLTEAYANSELLSVLRERDFDVAIYTESGVTGPSDVITNQINRQAEVASNWDLAKMYGKLVAFRYCPQVVKSKLVLYSGEFDTLRSFQNQNEYLIDDPAFFNRLKTQEIQPILDKPVFRFYHLFGAHAPWTMDENGDLSEEETSLTQQIRGEMKILEEYFNQLKSCGLYDDATIVIMADHGYENFRSNPLVLIKRPGETGSVSTNSTPGSYTGELGATFKNLVLRSEDESGTFFDTTLKKERGRIILDSTIERDITPGYYLDLYEYITYGHAKDSDSFLPTGRVYSASGTTDALYPYNLGDTLTAMDFLQATTHGFQKVDPTVYSREKSSTLFLRLDHVPDKNLKLTINTVWNMVWPSEISLYVNQNFVSTKSAESDRGEITFIIPRDFVDDTDLYLLFEYPGVAFIEDTYKLDGDFEVYSFELESVVLEETDEEAVQHTSQSTHTMNLGPRTLENSEVTEAGTVVHPDGMMHGYYMLMPEGEYYVTVTGENLDRMSLSVQGNAYSEGETSIGSELIRSEEGLRTYKITLNQLTRNTNFVFYNTTAEDFIVESIVLSDHYDESMLITP